MFREDIALGFAELVNGFAGIGHNMAMWQIALDGSGSFNSADDSVTLAGIVARNEAWMAFIPQWGALLEKHHMPFLHMTENGSRLPTDILLDFADVGMRLGFKCCGLTVASDALSQKQRRLNKLKMFSAVARSVLDRIPDDGTAAFICDEDLESDRDCYNSLARFKLANQGLARRIVGMCFVDDKLVPHVQFADMLAYLFREDFIRGREGRDRADPVFERLCSASTLASGFSLDVLPSLG